MKRHTFKVASPVLILAVLGTVVWVNAGVLNPPTGPVAPTMKTLDEVEPRIPISSVPYTISASGSYYFTGDLQVSPAAPADGVTIDADNVTLDLMGYNLIGPGPGSGANHGVYMFERYNVEIRNGTVREFGGNGVYAQIFDFGQEHRVIGIRAVDNGGSGIQLEGYGFVAKDCTAARNADCGIVVGEQSLITGCNAIANADMGIATGHSTVTDNTVSLNGRGIDAGSGSTVTNNTVYANNEDGILVGFGSTVSGNTVKINNQSNIAGFAGIRAEVACLIKSNTCYSNRQSNIRLDSGANAVEENLVVSSNGYGIYFAAGGNFYANNRARGNSTANYGGFLPGGPGNGGGNASF